MTRALRSRWRAPLAALAVAVMGLTLASAAGAAPTVTFQKSYGFSGPAGIYAYGMEWDASDNTILVGDYWNYRVWRYDTDGNLIGSVSQHAAVVGEVRHEDEARRQVEGGLGGLQRDGGQPGEGVERRHEDDDVNHAVPQGRETASRSHGVSVSRCPSRRAQ